MKPSYEGCTCSRWWMDDRRASRHWREGSRDRSHSSATMLKNQSQSICFTLTLLVSVKMLFMCGSTRLDAFEIARKQLGETLNQIDETLGQSKDIGSERNFKKCAQLKIKTNLMNRSSSQPWGTFPSYAESTVSFALPRTTRTRSRRYHHQ